MKNWTNNLRPLLILIPICILALGIAYVIGSIWGGTVVSGAVSAIVGGVLGNLGVSLNIERLRRRGWEFRF